MNSNTLEAWLDDEPSVAPSSFDAESFLDEESFLDAEDEPKGIIDTVKDKANKVADWWVSKRDTTAGKAASAVTKPFVDFTKQYEKTRNKYTTMVEESADLASSQDGRPVGIQDRALGGLGVVGGAIGYVTSPIEAGVHTFLNKPIEDLSGKYEGTNIPRFNAELASELETAVGTGFMGVPKRAAKVTSTVEEVAPALRKEPILDSSMLDSFLDDGAEVAAKDEAMGELMLATQQPFKNTLQQSTRTLDEIQAEINQVAADTSIPGAKEKLSALQAEKSTIDGTVRTPSFKGTHIEEVIPKEFEATIISSTKKALDTGNSAAEVRTNLEASLARTIKDPEKRAALVDKAVPAVYDTAEEFGVEVAHTYKGTTPETARGLLDIDTPDDGSILVPSRNVPIIDINATPIELKGKFRSQATDNTNMLSLVFRQMAKRNQVDVGSASLRELDDFTVQRNLSQRGNIWQKSIIGNPNGSDAGILWPSKGSELVPDTSIDNFNSSIIKAKEMGATADDLNEVMSVYNAYDDYANIDRLIQQADTTITALKAKAGRTPAEREELKYWRALKKEYTGKESFLTRAEVAAGVSKFNSNPGAKYFLDNKNAINAKLMEEMVTVGRISQKEADALLDAHPNYTPAWREVEDFTMANIEVSNAGGVGGKLKHRKISDKGELQDPLAASANAIVGAVRKIEQTQYRTPILNKLIKEASDEDFKVIFRESKADVQKAIAEIQAGNKQRWSASEITPTEANKVQKVGNITFNVEGGQIQLTVKDSQLFQEFSQPRAWANTNSLYDSFRKMAGFTRAFIVLNPEFSMRAIQRETMDASVSARTSLAQKLKYPIQNIKNVFAKDLKPDLYDHIANNIGYGSRRGHNLGGGGSFGADDLVDRLSDRGVGKIVTDVAQGSTPVYTKPKLGNFLKDESSGATTSVTESLEGFANRFDMAPRISLYEWKMRDYLAKGMTHEKAHEAAIFEARNLGVNFTQKGSVSQFDKVLRLVPFARSFMNGTDRMVMLGRYEPARMSRNVFMLYGAYEGTMAYNNQWKDADGTPFIDKLDPAIRKDTIPIYGPWSKDTNDYFPLRPGWVYGRVLPAMETSMNYIMQEVGKGVKEGIQQDVPEILAGTDETKAIDPKEVMAAWTDYITGIAQPASLLPPVMSQGVQLSMNQDFQGKPIVPEYLKDAPAWSQFNDTTPEVLTDFSYNLAKHGIEVSPAVSEYLLNSLFSSAAKYSLQAGDMIYGAATGREVPEIENRNIPGMSLVTGATSDVPREGIETKFSNMGKYLKGVQAEYDAIEKRTASDPNAYNDLQQFEIENAVALNYYKEWKDISSDVKPNRDAATAISRAKKDELQGYQTPENELLGDPEKRKAMNSYRQNTADTMKTFIDKVKQDPNADNIWYERLTRSGGTKAIEGLLPDEKAPTVTIIEPLSDIQEVRLINGKLQKTSVFDMMDAEEDNKKAPSVFDLMDSKPSMPFKPAVPPTEKEKQLLEPSGFFKTLTPNMNKKFKDMNKSQIINTVLGHEGTKFTNDPIDRGGATRHGVTLETLRLVKANATERDVRNLTQEQAVEIYDNLFWQPAKIDSLPKGVQDVVFDGAINHGVSGVTKVVQRALRDTGVDIKIDGVMGADTIKAMKELPETELRNAIIARRRSLYNTIIKKDPTQKRFDKGWKKRLASFESRTVEDLYA